MNFFERRRILKKISFPDLVPIRVHGHGVNENGKIDIFVPRFNKNVLKRALQTKHRDEFIYIHLDETGTRVWLFIDGISTTGEICIKLTNEFPEKFLSPEETNERVMKFVSLLYQERYITFKQISDK